MVIATSAKEDAHKQTIAVIGGSGLYNLFDNTEGSDSDSDSIDPVSVELLTPYSEEAVELSCFELPSLTVYFLSRHGHKHNCPPHKIPYKAQMWALHKLGVTQVVAVNAVGGIAPSLAAEMIVIPDQLIDYTWGREHTYFDDLEGLQNHIDFTYPYTDLLREILIDACKQADVSYESSGVYGCTQGPRLETASEIKRLSSDGCSIVGMTGMPEAALARELGIEYASLSLVVNAAAAVNSKPLSMQDIVTSLDLGMEKVRQVIQLTLPLIQCR